MSLLIILLITHYIADFLLQSRRVGENKSRNCFVMLEHIFIILFCFCIPGVLLVGIEPGIKLALFNATIHFAIDKGLSILYGLSVLMRTPGSSDAINETLNSWRYEKKYIKDKVFWDTIGLDQLLHILTIIILYSAYIF